MSKERSPRPSCSTTIGIIGMARPSLSACNDGSGAPLSRQQLLLVLVRGRLVGVPAQVALVEAVHQLADVLAREHAIEDARHSRADDHEGPYEARVDDAAAAGLESADDR